MDTNVIRTRPFFDRIRQIGYQPFIQIGIQSEAETDFVICHTQQELAQFADTLAALPQLKTRRSWPASMPRCRWSSMTPVSSSSSGACRATTVA